MQVSIKLLLILLSLFLVATTATIAAAMTITTGESALSDTETVGSNGINQCFSSGEKNVDQVASQLITKTIDNMEERMRAFLEPPVAVAQQFIEYLTTIHPDVSTDPEWLYETMLPFVTAQTKATALQNVVQINYFALPTAPAALARGLIGTAKWGGLVGGSVVNCHQQNLGRCRSMKARNDSINCDHLVPATQRAVESADLSISITTSRDWETDKIGTNNTHIFSSNAADDGRWDPQPCIHKSQEDFVTHNCFEPSGDCVYPIANGLVPELGNIAGRAFLNGLSGGPVDPANTPLWSPANTVGPNIAAYVYAAVTHPAGIPLFGPAAGPRTGYLLIGVSTDMIAQMMVQLELPSPGSRLYAVQHHPWTGQNGVLTGASHGRVDRHVPSSFELTRTEYLAVTIQANESTDPIIAAHATHTFALPHNYSGLVADGDADWTSEDNVLYWTKARLVDDGYKLEWFIILLVPRDEVMAAIDAGTVRLKESISEESSRVDREKQRKLRIMITTIVLIAVALTVLAVLLTLLIVRPLEELQNEMGLVAGMHLDGVCEGVLSQLSEVSCMQQSFRTMVQNLREFREYMPQSVLVDDTGDEDGGGSGEKTESRRSSRATGATSQRGTEVSRMVEGKFLEGMQSRAISVVVFNLCGWHKQEFSSSVHSTMIECMMKLFSSNKGVPDVFLGDRMFCAFNTVRTSGTHKAAAARCAASADEALARASGAHSLGAWQIPADCSAVVSCAAASDSSARFGNMGCQGMKKYTVIGSIVPWVHALERLNRDYGTAALVDHRMTDVENLYALIVVDSVMYAKHSRKAIMVHELGAAKDMGEDEWMYQLESAQANDKSKLWNEFALLVLRSDWNSAKEALQALEASEDALRAPRPLLEKFQHALAESKFEPRVVSLH